MLGIFIIGVIIGFVGLSKLDFSIFYVGAQHLGDGAERPLVFVFATIAAIAFTREESGSGRFG
jgi:hypothetical protein